MLENIADLAHSELKLLIAKSLCVKDFDMLDLASGDEIRHKICDDKTIKAKLQEIIKCPNKKMLINNRGDYASVYEAFASWIIGRIGIQNEIFITLETKRLYGRQNLCKSYTKIQNLYLQKAKTKAMLEAIKCKKLKNTKNINSKNNVTKSSGFMGVFSEALQNIDKGILDKLNLQISEEIKQIGEELKQNSEQILLDLKGFFNEK